MYPVIYLWTNVHCGLITNAVITEFSHKTSAHVTLEDCVIIKSVQSDVMTHNDDQLQTFSYNISN